MTRVLALAGQSKVGVSRSGGSPKPGPKPIRNGVPLWTDPFLVALADDAQDATGLVDGGDGKSSGLADPQAAAVNQAETAAVYRIADRGENAPHFGMGKRLRQPPLLGKPDLFLNSAQSWPSVFR